MKETKIPHFKIGGSIEYETLMVSEPQDIENALNICYAARIAIKEEVIKFEDFLVLSEDKKYYTLKNCELPISFSYNAIFIDGFKNCLKRLIKRLEQIQLNGDEIYCLQVLTKTKKKI